DHLQILSTQATTSVKDVIAARGKPIWYQLYATNKFEVAKHHVESAERQGATVVAITVDRSGGRNPKAFLLPGKHDTPARHCCPPLASQDPRNPTPAPAGPSPAAKQRNKPMYDGADLTGLTNTQSSAMSWDYAKRIRDATKMKVVLKGILAWEDAKIAAENGFDGIIVSNHGGRSDEAGRSTIESLQEIIEVSGSMPVFIDSGFRPRTHIPKAFSTGAKGVAIGRPYLWGLGAFGEAGVTRVLELLRTELRAAMQQAGAPS